jgi:hypothetical protein
MKKTSKLKEYSKRCIAAIITLWFVVALFGIGFNIYQLTNTASPEVINLDALYGYVGLPMTGGIVGYLVKSAMENKIKIKGSIGSNEDILQQAYEQAEEEENESDK